MEILEAYQKHLQLKKYKENEWRALCPFHKEDSPSFYVNSDTGQYYCFGCGRGGNVITFLRDVGDIVSKVETKKVSEDKATTLKFIEPISTTLIEQLHKNLLSDNSKLEYLLRERLLSFFIIKKFLIGYDPMSDRYAIPIKSKTGKFVNIKLHNSKRIPKSLSWRTGSGLARLYPISSIIKNTIVITEGEFDCLLLHSLGINAVTNTAGSNTWYPEWSELFKGKTVKVLYDSDEAGEKGSLKVARNIFKYADSVKIIKYPIEYTKDRNKVDVTDFVKLNGDIKKILL